MRPALAGLLLVVLAPLAARAGEGGAAVHLSRFGAGSGPSVEDGTYRLLDAARTPLQSNAVAFDRAAEGARESLSLACRMRVLEGGEGGAFVFRDTAEYGVSGPAPFVRSWTEPNLRSTFAVGIDVHDPPTDEPFGPLGNVLHEPEREVSLHWDGREIVKRLADEEFRGELTDVAIEVRHVIGGAEVTVRIGAEKVYDAYFVAGLLPYEARLAIGAQTREDATTLFDVADVRFEAGEPAAPRRPPLHVEVVNHVLTNNHQTAYEAEVDLPPTDWAFGRVILTLEIHDAGNDWDEWDRCGEVSVFDADGTKHGIVPFITSYRTPWRWAVDVTHFRPWLSGRRKLEVAAGTTFYKNRGYMMSVSLDFFHGTPALEPYRVVPLWVGTAHYQSDENHFQDFFAPQRVAIDEQAAAARVFVTTTGHSQVGEFTPSRRALVWAPAGGEEVRFENLLWKTDCYLNPNRPQYGTWKYPRAGWAPGDVVRPWWIDLTPHLSAGTEAEVRYEAYPYEFEEGERPAAAESAKASHIVRAYLILYRTPEAMLPAPTLLVTSVEAKSNAAKAGVKAGDYLERYDGKRVDTLDDLVAALQAAQAAGKEKVAVVVVRGSERIGLELDAGRMGVSLGAR